MAGVDDAGTYKSCGCQVGFQIFLQAANIVFWGSKHFLLRYSNAK